MGERTLIVGLTGSIGMGKSNAAEGFRRLGIPVFSADSCVHALLAPGGAGVAAVARAFPGTAADGGISRARLAEAVFGDDAALRRLEAILHPLVYDAERRFIRRQNLARAPLAVLEVPLLFETGTEALCDATVVVTAPPFVQEARVLARPGMTPARLAAVRRRQMPEAEKRRRADYVIRTGLDKGRTFSQLKAVVKDLMERAAVPAPDEAAGAPRRGPSRTHQR